MRNRAIISNTGRVLPGLALGLSLALLTGCGMTSQANNFEGINFREARYVEVEAMRDFRACRDEAVLLDGQARASGDTGRYLASARLLERCESDIGPEAATISREERMRAYGLSVQNYLKGGDAAGARRNLEHFKQAFPDNDLYYADGSSFRETMGVLLGQADSKDFGQFAVLNVTGSLKDEMRRMEYWKHN
jgi:hypothetical protein